MAHGTILAHLGRFDPLDALAYETGPCGSLAADWGPNALIKMHIFGYLSARTIVYFHLDFYWRFFRETKHWANNIPA